MTTILVCSITVVVGLFAGTADVKGTMIAQSDTKYYVNFSKEAKKNGYEGDYSKILVKKDQCVKLNGEPK